MTLSPEEREARINAARRVSPAQARFIADLVDARYDRADDAGRGVWRQRWNALGEHPARSRALNEAVGKILEDLKALPTLDAQMKLRQAEAQADAPTEPGFYRNPETGVLYRLSRPAKSPWDLVVKVYSKTGGLRRLSVEGNLVKGSWRTLSVWTSRQMLARGEIRKSWLLSEDELTEFAYGFCPYHGGPLTDGVSVALGYGKTCASKKGLPWSEEAAKAVLDAQTQTKENRS